jgi:hypothetical protein
MCEILARKQKAPHMAGLFFDMARELLASLSYTDITSSARLLSSCRLS